MAARSSRKTQTKPPQAFWVSFTGTLIYAALIIWGIKVLFAQDLNANLAAVFVVPVFLLIATLTMAASITISAFLMAPHGKILTRVLVVSQYILIGFVLWFIFSGLV